MTIIKDIESSQDTARGAVLLGTGGGGDPYVGELFLRKQLAAGKYPRIVSVDDLADDAFVVTVAGIGAPTVLVEHLLSEAALTSLLGEAEGFYKRTIDALICAEIGGANAMLPLAVGAITGIPVVDGDGIGRAFPHLEMTTFSINGCSASPGILADDLGNLATIHAIDNRATNVMVRALTGALGACLYGVLYPMTGAEIKRVAVRGTVTQALEIGREIRLARERSPDPVSDVVRFLDELEEERCSKLLFQGKVIDVTHETRDGFHWGQVTVESLGGSRDTLTIQVQNEFIAARLGERVLATVPDLICVLDSETAEPMTAEMLRYGARIAVIALSASPALCTPRALEVVGPRQFGLDMDWQPLDRMQ
ncbi:DUF917 domain-containing protein [Paraburkholderia agricolaris]|uniref:DUF917 domain-containing protein n=1 Tax=Paraburkholderia agricolaris TaxID=2152888 RepID=A0ABW8ZX17_9BURK